MPRLAAIAALIVALGGAAGAVTQWSPFAWAWDVRQIAQVTFETAISQKSSELINVQFLLSQTMDPAAVAFYRAREAELQRDLEWLKQEQQRAGQ